jgi:hypothetical protein
MDASMACHTGEKDNGKPRGKHVVRYVIPALPLRPVQRKAAVNKARDTALVENKSKHCASEPFPPAGQVSPRPDGAIKVQFGEMEEYDKHSVYCSPASFGNNTSSVDVTPSSLLSRTFALAQRGISDSEESLLDTSHNNDTSTQATSSWTSSSSPNFKPSSDRTPHIRQQPLQTQTPVVELPAEAGILLSSSLNISFLYQQDSDSDSTESALYTESVMADMAGMAAQALNGPCTSPSEIRA